jgi:hypothetical protein
VRAIPFVVIGCCLTALVVFGRSPSEDAAAGQPEAAAHAQAPAAVVVAAAPTIERSGTKDLPLRIVDRLTGAELPLEVALRTTDDAPALALAASEHCNLSQFPESTTLVYPLADGTHHEARLADCRIQADGVWILSLPYVCRVVVEFPPAQASASGEIYLCRPPLARTPAADDASSSRGPFELEGVDMTEDGALLWALRSNRAEVLLESAAESPVELAAGGPAALALHLDDGRSGYATLDLEPGQVVQVRPEWRTRPRLEGVLLDWEGRPVPDTRVRLAVAMDFADYDFRLSDPHALAVLRDEGVLHHSLTRRLKTDAEGRFSVIAPRGREYALYSHALGGHVMWTTLREPTARGDHTDLVLQLVRPEGAGAVAFEVRRPDGSPFLGARVDVCVVNDAPFFRQWPDDLWLDQDGVIKVLGLEVGEEVCLIVRHEGVSDGTFASPYMIVPPARTLSVVVPAARLTEPLTAAQ